MYPFEMHGGKPDSRYVALPIAEQDVGAAPGSPILALALFEIRLRDSLDFTVDFTDWLQANGPAVLSGGTWAVNGSSPKTPTIVGQAFSSAGRISAVLSPGGGAVVGDTYWMDITASIAAITVPGPDAVALPARTITRRVNIIVVNG